MTVPWSTIRSLDSFVQAVAVDPGSAERAVESLNSPPVIGRLVTGLRLLRVRAQWADYEGRHREAALGPKERSDMKLNSSDFEELD